MESADADITYHDEGFHRANPDRYALLKEHAAKMRACPTKAEEVLWACLRNKALGVSFRRQCVILDFIADFYSPEQSLIIEVDGGYHNEEEQIALDAARSERLRAKGYNILRFTNDEVLCRTEEVLRQIEEYIAI